MKLARKALLALVAITAFPATASAGIWTQIDSGLPAGSADIIQTIEYQAPDRLWYGTGSGKLFTKTGGAMTQTLNAAGVQFHDIAFKPGSPVGIAVGSGGNIWRTANAGSTWTRVNFNTWPACDTDSPNNGDIAPLTNPNFALYSVEWGPGDRVFVSGEDHTYLRSNNTGSTWTEINKYKDVEEGYPTYKTIYCRVKLSATDLVVLPVDAAAADNAIPLYMLNTDNNVRFSSDGLASSPATKANLGCSGSLDKAFAVDPVNPARQWSTTAAPGCFYRTEDDSTYEHVDAENPNGDTLGEMHDVAAAGSPLTVIAVGKGGDILNSADGQHFYLNRADGALATKDWHAVDGFDRDHFAVGGGNGTLIVTTAGSSIPDLVAPQGTITGPDTVTVGQAASFTANATDNAGGSGIDAASFAWTAPSSGGGSGQATSLTFTSAGTHTVKVVFRDVAGNVGEATKVVTVKAVVTQQPPPPPPALGKFGFSKKVPATARKKGKFVTVRILGKFKLPTGMTAAQACKGRVFLRVNKGKKKLAAPAVNLSSTCGFKKTIKIKRKKVGKARRLLLTISFAGNDAVVAGSKRYSVKVKRK